MRPCLQILYSSTQCHVPCTQQSQQLLAETSPKINLNLIAPALYDLSTSRQNSEDETAKHALNARPTNSGFNERCVCGHEPQGLDRNKVSNLIRHQKNCRIHSPQAHNNKSFPCSYSGCNKAYNRSDALVVHRRKKHGSLSNEKACSKCLCPHSDEAECSMNAASAALKRLHRRGAIHRHERPKRRASSLSPQLVSSEDEVAQRAVLKRRRLLRQDSYDTYS